MLDTAGTSLFLPVKLETTDTAEHTSLKALLDSGANGCFIDQDFIQEKHLNTQRLSNPITMFNIDGLANEEG